MTKIKTFISQLKQNFRIEFTENHLKKGSKFRKTVLFAPEVKHNVLWSDGRTNMWRKPGEEIRIEMFVQRLNVVVVATCVVMHGNIRSGQSSYYRRHHKQTRLCKHSSRTSENMCWKSWNSRTFCIYHDNGQNILHIWCLYSWLKVTKTPPQFNLLAPEFYI